MRLFTTLLAASVITGVLPRIAAAQITDATPSFAEIAGVAVDSIRGGHLRNALVLVSGTKRSAITDSLGRFTIDSIPPGDHRIRIQHAVLDSIGLSVVTPPRQFSAGETTTMLIGTPGPATIIAAKCPADARALGPAAVFGTIFDADTEVPSKGAQVSVAWLEIRIEGKSILQVPRRHTATVAVDGTFRLCGLPGDLSSSISATRGADTTAAVPVELISGLAIVTVYLPRSNVSAVVNGRISDVDNKPIVGARVGIAEDRVTATTGADGTFRIAGARSGTRTLTVRKLGYEPTQMAVNLRESEPFTADLKLAAFVPTLETVIVSAIRNHALQRSGFAERRQRGFGHFVTPEDIARRNPVRINDMLRGVSFLRFYRRPDGTEVIACRPGIGIGGPGCVQYFIDNVQWMSPDDSPDRYYHPSEIAAIEVYRSSVVPPRFMATTGRGEWCTVIVLWTKSGLRLR